jgi:hypothetical protein
MAQLTEQMVRECRTRWAAGEMQKTLCAEFGISTGQMSRLINGMRWAQFPGDRLCSECGQGGIEPSRSNQRTMHVACAAGRRRRQQLQENNPDAMTRKLAAQRETRKLARAERYAADVAFRERVDARRLYSMRDRPYLEGLRWRVLWSRYRLREADFLRLLAWQREACPCGEPFDSRPVVDHDHACCPSPFRRDRVVRDDGQRRGTCGKCTRGLLHSQCNVLVGIIEANPDVIQPIGWVEKYLAVPPYQEMVTVTAGAPAVTMAALYATAR